MQSRVLYLRYAATQASALHSQILRMSSFDAVLALFFRFYGNSEDGDAFFNSIRTLFLSFNTLMDRPLDEGVKIKVSWRKIVSSSCFLISLFHFILLVKSVCSYQAFVFCFLRAAHPNCFTLDTDCVVLSKHKTQIRRRFVSSNRHRGEGGLTFSVHGSGYDVIRVALILIMTQTLFKHYSMNETVYLP